MAVVASVLAVVAVAIGASSEDHASTTHAPVVLVVFDALPVQLLEDDHGQIDAKRFPNFAAFAANGTWYRHATTISESTRFSVPAILDGRKPRPNLDSDYASHPENLFTLLAPRYRLNVSEEATSMCPVRLCGPPSTLSVLQRLRHGRVSRFLKAVGRITDGSRPELSFIHVLMPHEPRQFLPDGQAYTYSGTPDPLTGTPSMDRRFLTEQVEQRTILQLEYTDHLLGELVAHMKREGVWDKSIVALTSDHGESFRVKNGPAAPFRVGQLTYRRAASERNLQDIAGIAMFVKYPGQRGGVTDSRFVHSVDLFPTILKAAGMPLPGGLMGTALNASRYHGHSDITVYKQDGELLRMPASRWLARVSQSKSHELSLFGTGDDDLFDLGPAPQLRGTAVSSLQLGPRTHLRATVFDAGLYARVRSHSSFIPAQAFGRLHGGKAAGHNLLFALNGTVVATAPSFAPVDPGNWSFSVMLSPTAFHDGANRLQIFEWLGGNRARLL